MKLNNRMVVSIAVAAVLAACSTAPERIESLEAARTSVPEVEASARAGVAPANIANARKSLDEADRLAESGGKLSDIEFHAQNAVTHAQIAHEKILTVEAQEQIASASAEQQAVLLKARDREVDASQQRADTLEEELADMKLQKTERGLVLTLGDVMFETGQATLQSGAYGTMDRLAAALRDKTGRSVVIEGHTDNVGSDAMNQGLSMQRAQSVQSALLQRGVGSDQITALGRGETSPVASNGSESGRQQNRRVEIILAEGAARIAER